MSDDNVARAKKALSEIAQQFTPGDFYAACDSLLREYGYHIAKDHCEEGEVVVDGKYFCLL